jgi:hypothetical protein
LIAYSNLDFGTGSVPDGWVVGFGTGTYSHTPTTYKGQPAVIHRQETTGRSYLGVSFTGTNAEHTIRIEFDRSRCLNMEDDDVILLTIGVTNSANKTWADVDANGILEFQTTFGADASGELRIGLGAAGNEDGDKTLVWGMPQMELGSYGTSFIPTSGSTYQRQADVAIGAGNSEVFNDSEGVLFADIAGLVDGGDGNKYLILSDKTTSNNIIIQYGNNGGLFLSNSGSSFYVNNNIDLTKNIKLAIKYGTSTSDYKVYLDGFEGNIEGSFSATALSGVDDLSFEYVTGSNQFNGKTKEIGVYDTALTDAELEALTSYTSFTNMANELNLTIK